MTAEWVHDAIHHFPDRQGEREFEAAGGDVLKAALATIARRAPLKEKVEALLHEYGASAVLDALAAAGLDIPGVSGEG